MKRLQKRLIQLTAKRNLSILPIRRRRCQLRNNHDVQNFRGALDARARKITIDMQIAAAKGIASLIPDELSTTNIIANAFDGGCCRSGSRKRSERGKNNSESLEINFEASLTRSVTSAYGALLWRYL